MSRNDLKSIGVPLFLDPVKDVQDFPKAPTNSWYVNCAFESDGKQLGFMWHQQNMKIGPVKISFGELLLLNGTDNICVSGVADVGRPQMKNIGENSVSIHTSIGKFDGNSKKFTMDFAIPNGKLNVELIPQGTILNNGAVGLFPLMGVDSHEFGYPDMSVSGTMEMNGHVYEIKDTIAWFDRQWVTTLPNMSKMSKAAWLWVGLPLSDDGKESISIWDYYQPARCSCATLVRKDGAHVVTAAEISYEKIWQSAETGNKYPKIVYVDIPAEQFSIKLTTMIDKCEFVQEKAHIEGCQNLCHVAGTYKGKAIEKCVTLEMIGNLCGD